MPNQYGLDFLKAEHNLRPQGDGDDSSASSGDYDNGAGANANENSNAVSKSDLEKQFEIIQFLYKHRSSGFLPPSIIYEKTGIDLSSEPASFLSMLLNNPKICTEKVPDPENPSISIDLFGYRAKFAEVHNKTRLLALINRCKNGVSYKDLSDAYVNVEKDLEDLITAGDILAMENKEAYDKTLFPRGEPFLVELDGNVSLAPPSAPGAADDARSRQLVRTTRDPRTQIRRGEAVWVGGQWFRASSAIKEGVPLKDQPPRAQAPASVVLLKDLSKKNDHDGYVFPMAEDTLPVDHVLADETRDNLRASAAARERQTRAFSALRACGAANSLLARSLMNSAPNLTDVASAPAGAGASGRGGDRGATRKLPSVHRADRRARDGDRGADGTAGDGAAGAGRPNSLASKTRALEAARQAAEDPALVHYSLARRHGCTRDVREMYLETNRSVPHTEEGLYAAMVEAGVMEEAEARAMRERVPTKQRKINVDNDGKPRKTRYYVNKKHRITNTHLENTELGRKLERAMERSAQGKDVGDGGM